MRDFVTFVLLVFCSCDLSAQPSGSRVGVWRSDLGNGMYQNPVLFADYSDPDVCRVGDDYYLVSSSFNCVPGLPLLHSKDLVNWELIGHALPRLVPQAHFETPRHGGGVWAPSIRYHENEFYIYYPDPDFGIYLVKAKDPRGPWSEPVLVEEGKGLIDPCPLWDDDGKIYLVYAYAGSRAGIKSILAVKRLSADGTKALDAGRIVYDGHTIDPTVEGPKFHKRNGYYYIFAPAGGVAAGWQIVLRSKNVYGPYERKVVLHQGKTIVNGPHQGAWVTTSSGEDWFIHFQDIEAYGRVVHLQPMVWENDWPVIGKDKDGDSIGEPVQRFKKPHSVRGVVHVSPPESDEFDSHVLMPQWQWHANPKATWSFLSPEGKLRLYSQKIPDGAKSLWDVPNLLLQKFPAPEFTVTTQLTFYPNQNLSNEAAGLLIMGTDYVWLGLRSGKDGTKLVLSTCTNTEQSGIPRETIIGSIPDGDVYLQVQVSDNAKCVFSYSIDGKSFSVVGDTFQAVPGKWIGAKVGLFCTRDSQTNDSGFVDIEWFRITK